MLMVGMLTDLTFTHASPCTRLYSLFTVYTTRYDALYIMVTVHTICHPMLCSVCADITPYHSLG